MPDAIEPAHGFRYDCCMTRGQDLRNVPDAGRGWAAWGAALVALASFAAFLPALGNGWVNWDDGVYLLENPHFRGLSVRHLLWMFTTTWSGVYQPLPWLTYAADYKLWGLNPAGYHLTSLLFHCANAVLAFWLARRLFVLCREPESPRQAAALEAAAMFAALAFAVHPLRVESVAWAWERRDVVCGTFSLACVLAALRAREKGSGPALAMTFFAAALLSKALAVTLPLTLLILDGYPLRRIPGAPRRWLRGTARSVWLEKIPYLLLALGMGLFALWAQAENRALWSFAQHGLPGRFAQAAYGAMFYVGKTIFPFGLAPIYEMPAHPGALGPAPGLAAAGFALTTLLAWRLRRKQPGLLAAWLCYLAALAPVLGLLQAGSQLVADRYSYLSCLPWALLAAGWLRRRLEGNRWPRAGAAAAALILALGSLAWRQTRIWKGPLTLWARALEASPQSPVAQLQMGVALAQAGRTGEAAARFAESLRLNPVCVEAEDALMQASAGRKPPADAPRLLRILDTNPVCRQARRNWFTARAALGDLDGAIAYFDGLARLQPRDAGARANLERARREKASRIGRGPGRP